LAFTGTHSVIFQKIELFRRNLDANIDTGARKLQKDIDERQKLGPQCT
jgi:hypothetical protein